MRLGAGPSFFQLHHQSLSAAFESGAEQPLRKAQVGALWALAARCLERARTSQAILPTGTGKTAVITALPFAVAARRVLVVVPSNIVRRQVVREFHSLHLLRQAGAIPRNIGSPRIKSVMRRITSTDSWRQLGEYDVVVATPQCISIGFKGVPPPPDALFDQLIVDEAHHTPAPTWSAVLEEFRSIPCSMLTATPVRRDRRQLPGEIVYIYSLRDAISDGIYWPIAFIPVRPRQGEAPDAAIARTASARINTPRHVAAGSQLLVRTDRVDEAYRLRALYGDLGVRLPVLEGRLRVREIEAIIDDLEAGRVRGAIVIGVLTEGFNLPRLKIAAYHAKHRSFAATLQFVGRLARAIDGAIIEPELVALPDDIASETESLYAEDASWSALLPDIADATAERERAARHYAADFVGVPEEFAMSAVEPRHYTKIYRLPRAKERDLTVDPHELAQRPIWRSFRDGSNDLVGLITLTRVHPQWLRSPALDTAQYDLHLIFIDRNRDLLFVSSDTAATTQSILEQYDLNDAILLDGEEVGRVLRSFPIEAFSSIGVRNDRIDASLGATYKGLAGPAAERGVTTIDRLASSAGHAIGRFRDGGSADSVGAAFESAKFWQSSGGSLLAWRDWCEDIGERLLSQPHHGSGIAGLALRHRLAQYPANALCAVLPPIAYMFSLRVPIAGAPDISIADVDVRVRSGRQFIILGLAHMRNLLAVYQIGLDGKIVARRDVTAQTGNEIVALSEILNEYPPAVAFSDGSSAIAGQGRSLVSLDAPSTVDTERWDWTGVDITAESSIPTTGHINILARVIAEFSARYPDSFVVVDDGAHEIADCIVIRRTAARQAEVMLVHCKWSSRPEPGQRLTDVYELLAQASRSVRWALVPALIPNLLARLRNRASTHVAFGDELELAGLLEEFSQAIPRVYWHVYAIQPGLVITGLEHRPNLNNMIEASGAWCEEQSVAFHLCGS